MCYPMNERILKWKFWPKKQDTVGDTSERGCIHMDNGGSPKCLITSYTDTGISGPETAHEEDSFRESYIMSLTPKETYILTLSLVGRGCKIIRGGFLGELSVG